MDWYTFIVFLVACCAAASTGAMFPPGPWYDDLNQPGFIPPNWLFPIAWSVLYVVIAYAASRVANMPGAGVAIGLWATQNALNAVWTPVYFGLRRMKAALIVLGALWLAVAGTIWSFWQLDPIAGMILTPYLVWVSFAGLLNFSFMRLNPDYAT